MILKVFKWLGLALLGAMVLLVMSGCTMLGLNYASLEVENKPAPDPVIDVVDFQAAANVAAIKQAFEDSLYGPWPGNLAVTAGDWRMVDPVFLDGKATLEEAAITIGSGPGARTFHLVVALPVTAPVKAPILISQTFSDNCSAVPGPAITAPGGEGLCDGSRMGGAMGFVATQIFGTYIAEVPFERYIDAGLGYATFYGGEFVPDRSKTAPGVMNGLGEAPTPQSTLMAWAYGYEAAAQVLAQDDRINADAIAALGHSRYGKAALIAAAWGEEIDAALAHQSGFAGAALSRSETGEGLARMASTYPHWLVPGLANRLEAGEALPLDQHYLLALAAPRPILLGNGRRDVWSDPNSSYRAAAAADAVYEDVFALEGLPDGADLRAFDPGAEIAWWLRPGGHSVVSEDIDAFIAFMDAQFGNAEAGAIAAAP